jgi:hypothetical protein
LFKGGNGATKYVGIDAKGEKVDKDDRSGGGLVDEANCTERSTRLAKRIWEAFGRYRGTTSKVPLPAWEVMDEGQRKDMISLAAEALGYPKES